jgi:hypothetical protein
MGFRGGPHAKELGGVTCGETIEQTLNAITHELDFCPIQR